MIADPRARRSGLILVTGFGIAVSGGWAAAQQRTSLPDYTGDRIYTTDVAGSYDSLNRTIKELERSSPQSYFVVLIRSAGSGDEAVTKYLDVLYDTWRGQAKAKGLKLDPERSVITLVAIADRRVAVHAGATLQNQLGLDRTTRNKLIDQAFVPLAREQKYTEAIASLLANLNNEVAKHDRATAMVQTGTPLFPAVAAPARAAASAPAQISTPPLADGNARSASNTEFLLALAVSLLAVGLIVGFLVWLARRRTRTTVEGKIKEFRKKSVDVMDRLDALKARLKQLPVEDPDFKEPMAGATLALYGKTQQNLSGLWDRWLEVMDILDKAQALAQKDSALGSAKLKEADKLVSDSKVFEQIEAEARACSASLDQLNQAHESARSAAEVLVMSQKEITARVEKVEKEGLPTVPYRPEIDGIAAQADRAREILTPDPIGSRQDLDRAQERAVTLRDRIQQILERYADGRRIASELAAIAEQVAGQRKQGLRLDEEGGNPDHPIAQTFQKLEALRKAIHEGDPQTALAEIQAAEALLEQSRQTLDGVLRARTLCATDQPERVQQTRRLREAMAQYEAFDAELKRDFAPESWQPVAGNLAQARSLLETFDRKTDEIASAASSTSQKYLLGARLLGQVSQEQQAVFELCSGIGDVLSGLKALRQQCQTAIRDLDDQQHAAEMYLRQNDQVVGSVARGTYDSAQNSRQQLAALLNQSRPDWSRIRQLLARTAEEFAIARNQAEGDVQTYQQLSSEFDRVRQEANRLGAFLAGHEEDRPAANQHYQNAETALAQVQAESTRPGGEWARWLEMVRGAAADLAHADRLAQEDVRLARQAEAEIREAAQTLRKARAYFSMGVTLSTVEADNQLAEADRLYRSQNYEQAIRTAAAAIQQVRQAQAMAAQQAFLRQVTIESNQRRMSASPPGGPALSVGGTMGAGRDNQAGQVSPTPGDGSEPGPESGTAAGSWSSETAERGW